jgi:hypothetical protein
MGINVQARQRSATQLCPDYKVQINNNQSSIWPLPVKPSEASVPHLICLCDLYS